MKTALLLIDLDYYNGWTPAEYTNDSDKKRIAKELCGILEKKRKHGDLIVFIALSNHGAASGQEAQYNLPRDGSCMVCGPKSKHHLADFLNHRHDSDQEPVFIKDENDAFSNKNLEKYLRDKKIQKVELAGCFTDLCVKATAVGALKAGFAVALLAKVLYPPSICTREDANSWIHHIKTLIPAARKKLKINIAFSLRF